MAIKVFKSNVGLSPIGVSDTSGYRVAMQVEAQASRDTQELFGTINKFAADALTVKRTEEAQSDAATHTIERDANGLPTLPAELPSEFTVYGKEYRRAMLNRYANETALDTGAALSEFAAKAEVNGFDAKGFREESQAYIKSTVEAVDPRIRPTVLADAQSKQSQHFNHLLGKRTQEQLRIEQAVYTKKADILKSDVLVAVRNGTDLSSGDGLKLITLYKNHVKTGRGSKEQHQLVIDEAMEEVAGQSVA